jgi:SIR2-like domain
VTSAIKSNFETASEEDLLTAISTEVAVSDSGKKPTFIFGTGLTIGLSNNHRASSWSGLLQEVLKRWEPFVKDKPPEVSAPGWVLTKSTDGDCLVAAAYVLRRQMMVQSASSDGSLSTNDFAVAIRDVVEDLCSTAIKNVTLNPASSPGLVGKTLKKLGICVKKGKARVLTTNYDDLVARIAELNILLPDGRYFKPKPTESQQPFDPPYDVPENLRRMSAWMNIEDCAANPDDIACVLHLHGWHGKEDAIVIDPVTYHEICKLPEGSFEEKARILFQCNSKVAEAIRKGPVIYYGMGAGMLDQHFEALRRLAIKGDSTDLDKSNFWLLTKKDYDEMGERWFKLMGTTASAKVVSVESHLKMEELLGKVVDVVESS